MVGVHFNRLNQSNIEVSDIRTFFPKQSSEWLNWIQQGKATYLNKKSLLDLAAQQRTTLADVSYLDPEGLINIINGFENPNIASEQSAQQRMNFAEVGYLAPNVAGETGGWFEPSDPTRAKPIPGRPDAGAASSAESGTVTQQQTNFAEVSHLLQRITTNIAKDIKKCYGRIVVVIDNNTCYDEIANCLISLNKSWSTLISRMV